MLNFKPEQSPAVCDDGPGVRGVAGLDPAQEGQEGGGVLRDAVVRPRRKLELSHLTLLTRSILGREGGRRERERKRERERERETERETERDTMDTTLVHRTLSAVIALID